MSSADPPVPVVCADPAYFIENRETRDADELAACSGKLDQLYEQLTPGHFHGRHLAAGFRGVYVFREESNQATYQAGLMDAGHRIFGIPLKVTGHGNFCGHPISTERIVTTGGGEEFDFRSPQTLDIVCVSIDAERLARHAFDTAHMEIERALKDRQSLEAPQHHAAEFRNTLAAFLEAVSRTPDMLRYEAIQKGLEHALLSCTAGIAQHFARTRSLPSSAPARHAIVSRAREYMHAHQDEPLTVEELCQVLGVSRRTLQYSFQAVLGTSPVAYLRAMRLNGVRRALRSADPATDSVQDIAARWGFWHLSNFARYYRQLFGELPSATLQRARRASPSRGQSALL